MSRTARVVVPDIPHHVTQRGNNRQTVFLDDDDLRFYVSLLRKASEEAGLCFLAYCLMPNHVHLVTIPHERDSLAKGLGRAHLHYTQWFNRTHGSSGHLWQNRFYSCPLDEAHCDRAIVYVEHNPVRASLAALPWEYRWSSAKAHIEGTDTTGLLDLEGWRERWDEPSWRELLLARLDGEEVERIRRCTSRGRPFGSTAFVESLESQLGRSLRASPVGRPRGNWGQAPIFGMTSVENRGLSLISADTPIPPSGSTSQRAARAVRSCPCNRSRRSRSPRGRTSCPG
ncbi:MAG: transposase [Armatimonadetes bacterium]|nr:transposase [Armatimonadota bacterium]